MEYNNFIMLGLTKALEDQLHKQNEADKVLIKEQGLSFTNDTAIVKTNNRKEKIYTEENQKKIDKLKKKCSEAIASIPYEEIEVENASCRITSSVNADEEATLILEALLNPSTKDKVINFIRSIT